MQEAFVMAEAALKSSEGTSTTPALEALRRQLAPFAAQAEPTLLAAAVEPLVTLVVQVAGAQMADALLVLAGDPPEEAARATGEAEEPRVCGTGHAEVARMATALCALLTPDRLPLRLREHIENEERTWGRARSLLWGDVKGAEAADAVARDEEAPPLVRAVAALCLGADDMAEGREPRAEVWRVLRLMDAMNDAGLE